MIVRCEHCGLDMEAPPDSVGQTLRCPGCGETFVCKLPQAIVVTDQAGQDGAEELILLEEVVEEEEQEIAELPDSAGDKAAEPEADEEESPLAAAAAAVEEVSADEALEEMGKEKPKPIVKENPRQWYVMVGGVAAVALTYQELAARAGEGKIKPRTKIYYAPADLTVPAKDIPGLFREYDEKRKKKEKPAPVRKPRTSASSEVTALAEALGHLGEKEE